MRKILSFIISCVLLFVTVQYAYAEEAQDFIPVEHQYSETGQYVTRGKFAKLLHDGLLSKGIYIVEGSNGKDVVFADLESTSELRAEILYLARLRIIQGDDTGNFRPNDSISFKDAVTMSVRAIMSRDFVETSGGYPHGYVIRAAQEGITKGISHVIEENITEETAIRVVENTLNRIQSYNIMKPLNCESFNGQLYVEYFPKAWQGYEMPNTNADWHYRQLPAKLCYSYDGVTWEVAYEDVDGERVYYNLPTNIKMDSYVYSWADDAFEGRFSEETGLFYHSYDLKNWHEGSAVSNLYDPMPVGFNIFPFGITKEMINSDKQAELYFECHPYEVNYLLQESTNLTLTELKFNKLWVSKDSISWIGIDIPDEMMFFTGYKINHIAKSIEINGALEFTDDEETYLDELETEAHEKGKKYDRPKYKIEKYLLTFDKLNDLFLD